MSSPAGTPSLVSVKFGNILFVFVIASLGFIAFYIYYYFNTFLVNDFTEIKKYMLFRRQILQIIPFIIVVFVFFMSLWVYTIYVDFNNLFKRFDRSPTNAMFNVLLPVINLYGIGMSYTRIVNFIDAEPENEEYDKSSFGLKIGLVLLYAGITGIFATMMLGFNFPDTVEQFQKRGMLLFHGIAFTMIILAAAGIITMIINTNRILKYRATVVHNLF